MLCVVGSQAGEEDCSAFLKLKLSKVMTFSRKSIHAKLEHLFSFALISGNNKEKQHEKICLCLKQARNWGGNGKAPWKMCWT